MRIQLAHLVMIGMLVSGFEGALDAARVSHTDGDGLAHEMHERHLGHAGGERPADESGADHHICHCGVHVPPLAFRLIFAALALDHDRFSLPATSHSYQGGPPPLPPPIA